MKKDLNVRIVICGGVDLDGAGDDLGRVISQTYPDATTEITSAPAANVISLLQAMAGGDVPDEMQSQGLTDAFVAGQFSSALFTVNPDVVVLSILPDILLHSYRHLRDGYVICPPTDWETRWTAAQKGWLQEAFVDEGMVSAETYTDTFAKIITHLREQGNPEIVLLGAFSFDPQDHVHNYYQRPDTLSVRAHRLNLAMFHLSMEYGINVIDVDRLLSEQGAKELISASLTYTDAGKKLIHNELFRVIRTQGVFDTQEVTRLHMPKLDRQFRGGSIVKWYKEVGDVVEDGDKLFDLRVEEINRLKRVNADSVDKMKTEQKVSRDWSWLVRISAAASGYVASIDAEESAFRTVGELVAVITRDRVSAETLDAEMVANAPGFRVASNVLTEDA